MDRVHVPARCVTRSLSAVIQEACIQGVSTRSVDDLVKAMGMTGISKSQVARLCAEIEERVDAFLNRPLKGEWPYLWLDATYLKVRRAGRIVSVAAIVAVAVNTDGRREVLGIAVQPSEAEAFRGAFLRALADRGLRGVRLIIADEHKGLKAAAAKVPSLLREPQPAADPPGGLTPADDPLIRAENLSDQLGPPQSRCNRHRLSLDSDFEQVDKMAPPVGQA